MDHRDIVTRVENEVNKKVQKWDYLDRYLQTIPQRIRVEFPRKQVTLSQIDGELLLTVSDMEGLHAARQWLRKAFGKWNDRLDHRWYSAGAFLTSWECTLELPVKIWLAVSSLDDYPEELQDEHCQWVQRETRRETDFAYVCDARR